MTQLFYMKVLIIFLVFNTSCHQLEISSVPLGRVNEKIDGRQLSSGLQRSWERVFSANHLVLESINFSDQQQGIVTGASEHFLLTSDGGHTWNESAVRGNDIEAKGGAYNLTNSAMSPSGAVYTIGHLEEVGSAIFSSKDAGKTWQTKTYWDSSLNDISMVGNRTWVVGNEETGGIVLFAQGDTDWKQIWKSARRKSLSGVDFIDETHGWCVGGNGLILQTNDGGKSWKSQKTPKQSNLLSIAFADTTNGYTVGVNGTILGTRNGGKTWVVQNSGIRENLTKVVVVGPAEAWVIGQNRTVLFTTNSGEHWQKLTVGTEAEISDITSKDGEIWLVAGGTIFRLAK